MKFIRANDFRFNVNLYEYQKSNKELGRYDELRLSTRKQNHINLNPSLVLPF